MGAGIPCSVIEAKYEWLDDNQVLDSIKNSRPHIVGFTAFKSVVNTPIFCHFRRRCCKSKFLSFGENVRSIYDEVYGFSVADRLAHLKNLMHLNQVLQNHGIIPITATIGGLHEFRDMVRRNLKNPRFIYLDCPFDVAAQRDHKGNYARALAGELNPFFGVDIPFQPPVECEMRIDSASLKPSEITSRIMEHFIQTGLIRRI